MSEPTLNIGRDKTPTPVSQVSERDLEWYATKCRAQGPREIAQAEQERRRKDGGAPPGSAPRNERPAQPRGEQPRRDALAKRGTDAVTAGPIHDPEAVTARLREQAQVCHLVSPMTSCDALPPGFGVAQSAVFVDPSTDKRGPGEVYPLGGGKLGLGGTALKKIAAAAGVDWNPRECGRLDNGSDPHYCHYRAVGTVRNFDGSMRTLTGEVEVDMREDSPQVDEIRKKAEARERDPEYRGKRDGGASQILEMRKFILRHAETKAKLRAITDLGLKRSYTAEELQKPFAVARLMWTGQSDDPDLKREFARMGAERFLNATSAAYGPPPPPAQLPAFQGHAPPPVGSVDDDPNDYGGYDVDANGHSSPHNDAPNYDGTGTDDDRY